MFLSVICNCVLLLIHDYFIVINFLGRTSCTLDGVIDPFQAAQARQPDCKDPYKLFGPICMELSNPGVQTFNRNLLKTL